MHTALKVLAFVVLPALIAAWVLWTPDKGRAALERSYLAAPTDMATALGVRLHVRDSGPRDAPPVLLLHGFGASLHTWEPWAQALSRDLRVLRIDLPGNGLSHPDPSGDYSDQRSMALIVALLDQRGIDRVSLVGHSIGGRIAWMFAATHPQRVRQLVLVSPDGFASPGFAYGQAPQVPAAVRSMRFILPRWLLRMGLQPAYADRSALTDALATRYHDLVRAPGARDAMLARLQQTVLVDPVPLLRRIQAPTLLLWGRQDGMIPFSNAADYGRAIPDNRLVALEGAGHVPHEEAPERSLVPVRAFLLAP